MRPSEWTQSGCWFDHQPGMLFRKLREVKMVEYCLDLSLIV